MKTTWHFLSIPLVLAWLMASGGAQAEELREFKLVIKNGRFIPETLEVPAGVRFRLVITNQGPGPEEFESYELKKESVMGEGVTRSLVFAPLKAGSYRFFGEFHPDTAKGRINAR